MSATTRREVLEAICSALAPAVEPAPLPEPLLARFAGSEVEVVAGFVREAEAAGAQVATAADAGTARSQIARWLEASGARAVLCAPTPQVRRLTLEGLSLPGVDIEALRVDAPPDARRLLALAADVGISYADYGLADTGTLALRATPEQGRLLSLAPPTYIAILPRQRIVPDLASCFAAMNLREETRRTSLLTLITGPSRTADIEQTLTVGVHGPGRLYILVLA
jgi:L-lactate dehydrogenase complex protein LldG